MTIKLKYNKERFILFAILALCIFSCLILPGMITMLLSVLAISGYSGFLFCFSKCVFSYRR